jgi:hypothetical protein
MGRPLAGEIFTSLLSGCFGLLARLVATFFAVGFFRARRLVAALGERFLGGLMVAILIIKTS